MKHLPIIFLLFFGLIGCLTKEKALRKLDKALPQICAEKFPVKDSTIYLPGDTVNTVEFFENSDTVVIETKDTVTLTVTNTITKVVRERITDTLRLVRENTARVAQLQADNDRLQTKLNESIAYGAKWHGRAKDYLIWLIMLGAAIVSIFAIKLFKK